MTWDALDYWKSDAWKKVQEKLDVLDRSHGRYNPGRALLFRSLELCPFERTRVAIIGQDPYPNPDHCTGLAFSLPIGFDLSKAPSTWLNIKRELCTDLHIPSPKTGSLESWARQGVLLWNAIPTCLCWNTLSHDWPEWESLTTELITGLSKNNKGCVVLFLGSVARRYLECVKGDKVKVICTSHPSPRGAYQSNPYLRIVPFIGSRIFSTTNDYLRQLKLETIDWRL